ncbi:ATP-binding cassette domain-containing protein [Streptomyces sp. NBC_01481]|uniref:ABC transporter ATP-binding protein n=1 Tax=Streptomyces sp. NBC_01481 TaxID=2975869 RepID=UPI00224D5DB6|nr:ATP-binding cassette domain-containing protein [Streptomyces sp. NBC_01481]MCX4584520.1 ATP-binding cassette domain-containing protein [Streptomyces sp. NBC_01481]
MRATKHPETALELKSVTAGYDQSAPVFVDLSLSLPGRGLTMVSGRNGSGKSTFLELCSGYLPPWHGQVRVGDRDARDPLSRTARRVCRTDVSLYPSMTVRDHLVFAARCHGISPDPGLKRAVRYGLEPWLDHAAKELSTGNRRKLWLTMCTLGEFALVMLDEPFNGLDSAGIELLSAEMCAWATHASVVLIAHDPPATVAADTTITLDGFSGASPGSGE